MDETKRFELAMKRLENAPLFGERTERLLRVAERVLPYVSLLMFAVSATLSALLVKAGFDLYTRLPDLALMTWALAALFTCASLIFKKQSGY
jgi:hypothetical protein